ncbi:MAG: flagellar basal-body MS-ring/collar protein FliF [Anderseniella sp.]
MNFLDQLSQLWRNLAMLGARRLVALGLIATFTFITVAGGAYYISRPAMIVLYSNLEPGDVNAIGTALRETGFAFDVSEDGRTVLTGASQATRARMVLAERGLPQSSSAGYELFDKMGSLGLTSFMQNVTMVRALEGELVRTIQGMKGVKSARVHLVMAEKSTFRRKSAAPSASVVLRQAGTTGSETAQAIRYLVAAAVPGMSVGQVTVLSSDGKLLATGDDSLSAAPGRLMELERTLGDHLSESIQQTLAPHIGLSNFNVSVQAKLNIDRQEVNEKVFDPDNRVERSIRSVKETLDSEDSSNLTAATVTTDIPQPAADSSGQVTKQQSEKRDETTNYEINTKVTQSVSEGYKIDKISVAVLINRTSLLQSLGDGTTDDQVTSYIVEMQELVSSVAGLSVERGDQIVIKAVQFVADAADAAPSEGFGIASILGAYTGALIQAVVILGGLLILIFAGIKPAIRLTLNSQPQDQGTPAIAGQATPAIAAQGTQGAATEIAGSDDPRLLENQGKASVAPDVKVIAELAERERLKPENRLEQLVSHDVDQATVILKQWLREGGTA